MVLSENNIIIYYVIRNAICGVKGMLDGIES